ATIYRPARCRRRGSRRVLATTAGRVYACADATSVIQHDRSV
ncbi:MAG: hypothetical protein AVDCRST_MAG26-4592, partial [uncultured Chloroflexia bacterium]